MTASAGNNRQYYPALDGLRGMAILMVLVYHNFGFTNYFFFGWLGVDLFFVLSGFLITNILLTTVNDKNFLQNFYLRRILRIFPLYYVSLAICLLLIPAVWSGKIDFTYYTKNQLWFWAYLQNWLFIFKNPENVYLTHFWSLAVEEQFYMLWPFLVLWIRKPGVLLLIVFLALLTVLCLRLLIWTYQIEHLSYFSLYTFTRIDGICIGCMIALVQRVNSSFLIKYTPVIVTSLAIANFIFYFFNRSYQFTFPYLAIIGYTTFAVILGLLVFEATLGKSTIIDFIFTMPVLKFFGNISYGLYIIHWPIYILLLPVIISMLNAGFNLSRGVTQVFAATVATGLAILLSYLSHRYFESYFIKLKSKFA